MAGTAEEKRIERALNDRGLVSFRGRFLAKDLPKVKSLSAKTDKTVSEVRAQVAAKGKGE